MPVKTCHHSPLSALALAAATCMALSSNSALAQSVDDQYRLGLYQRETGQPYAAIETLSSVLAANPSLNRARLELAVAYYRTLNFAKAKAEAQRVLDDPKTPAEVRLSVLSFVKTLELEEAAQGKAHKFEPSVSLGLLYDSNVNAGPDSPLLGNGLVLNNASLAKSDWGYSAQGALTHTWQRQAPVQLGQTAARFGWTSQAALYYKGYNEHDEFNLGVVSVSTGPTLVVGNSWRGNVNLQLDHITLGGANLGLYTSLSPSLTWRLGATGELTADAQFTKRDYKRSIDTGRDSDYRSLGLSYGQLLMQGRVAVQAGVRFFDESADLARFSNDGNEVFVGGRVRAWAGGDLFARAAWRRSSFDGVEPVFGLARKETEQRIELGASHKFNAGWLEKWLLSATITHVHNKANMALYGYDRDTVMFNLSRSF